ncbi:1849_t:CDS:2 [Entrophospora sp. SA101]|nr:8003_t:CDS:2 [Entrophospora sp. SA101]CAJ0884866.1 1849_t:CDS:2 [Entrophospora sp. SA101]
MVDSHDYTKRAIDTKGVSIWISALVFYSLDIVDIVETNISTR